MLFEFTSDGAKGKIEKIVKYSKTDLDGFFNLAFGDKGKIAGDINDFVITNNGDSEKILSTVVATIIVFTEKYPGSWIYATGSTKARTRLYRMGITKHLKEIEDYFDLYGLKDNKWERFKKGVEYKAFLTKRKKH